MLFAAVEIEIEGLARVGGAAADLVPRHDAGRARFTASFMSGKPLTGYHAVMFVLPLWSFHIGFVGGVPWSWAAEATTLSAYLVWVVTWDLLWFLFNPRFGWARFRKGEVWWHDRTWIGRFPVDYWGALALSLVIAATARLTTGDFGVLARHVALCAGFAALTLALSAAAPAYMRWHAHMRRPGRRRAEAGRSAIERTRRTSAARARHQ